MATATPNGWWYSTSLPLGEVGGASLDAAVLAKGMLSVLLDTFYFEIPESIPPPPSGKWAGVDDEEPQPEVVESPTEASYFKAYPNPFNQQLTVAYDLKEDCVEGCFLRIFDMSGRLMYEQTVVTKDGPNTLVVDMNSYEGGIYICSLYNNQRLLQTTRLVRME